MAAEQVHLTTCVEQLALDAPPRPRHRHGSCKPVYLGPDVGWQDSVFDEHRSCREKYAINRSFIVATYADRLELVQFASLTTH